MAMFCPLGSEAVHERAPVVVGVVAVRELHAGGMPLRLQLASRLAQIVPRLGLAHPDRREEILAPQHGYGDEEVGHRVPRAADLTGALGGLQPTAVLLAQPVGDVAQVDQIAVVLAGEDLAHEVDQVVAGARRELCRIPGGQLEVRDMVHPDLDPGLVAPQLAERKSTRLNSSHSSISYAVFCLKKKKKIKDTILRRRYKEYYTFLLKMVIRL